MSSDRTPQSSTWAFRACMSRTKRSSTESTVASMVETRLKRMMDGLHVRQRQPCQSVGQFIGDAEKQVAFRLQEDDFALRARGSGEGHFAEALLRGFRRDHLGKPQAARGTYVQCHVEEHADEDGVLQRAEDGRQKSDAADERVGFARARDAGKVTEIHETVSDDEKHGGEAGQWDELGLLAQAGSRWPQRNRALKTAAKRVSAPAA